MATDFWNGTGNWSTDDAAWSDNSPPISTEDAEIQTGIDSLTSTSTIAALQVDAPASLELTTGGVLIDTGLATIAGTVFLQNGATVSTTGGLSITGNALVEIDGTNIGGNGGSKLTIGGTLTNASTNGNGLDIGNNGITSGDTVTATALNSTGVIQITGNGTIQSTLDITTGAAGFGTIGVETGSISLTTDALLEFASGQIGTIDGFVGLNGGNARIADAGTLTTNSALAGLTSIAGSLYLQDGASVSTTGGLSLIGNALVEIDGTNIGGNGGSSLTIGGTLTNTSTNGNGLDIGWGGLTTGDTVTATALNNTGIIQITGIGTIQSTLDITTGAAGFGTIGVETGSVSLTTDALLEFASGQIGTIDGFVGINGSNARIADAGTLATNSALTGLATIAGTVYLQNGATVSTTGGLSLTGNALVEIDGTNIGGNGGSKLTIGGTLTNASTNGNGLDIGNNGITSGDTVTATALNSTGVIQITGNGTIQSTLDITTGAAGFGTIGVETGSVTLTTDALLEFASGQIGTIDGFVGLNGPNARIADAGTLATNSALTGLKTVAGELVLYNGASITTTSGLSLIGNAVIEIDGPNFGGSGGSSLTIGGTLTNSSTNGNALDIGNNGITLGDTVTATALVNTGAINIEGNGTIQSTLDITSGAAGFGTLGVETGSVGLTGNALLEFASGQIGTIDGFVGLNGPNARIADAGTLATNSALAGLKTIAGDLVLYNGASITTTSGLSLIGNAVVEIDGPNFGGGGGSSLTVGGTLTNSSTNGNALDIGNTSISAGDTVTATALVNTGAINIEGNGTIQSTLDITSGAAGFGTLGVETGSVGLTGDALLEFASGQIGTIDGFLGLNGVNARIADAGTLATNSALAGLNTVVGELVLYNGASVSTTAGLSITGNAVVEIDGPNFGGGGGSSLTIGGTLTNSSTNGNGLDIGTGNISAGDTVTAGGLVNTGAINIEGNGTVAVATLQIDGAGTNSATVNIDGSGEVQMGAGDVYTQAAGATNVNSGGTLAGTVDITGGAVNLASGGTLAGTANVTGGFLDGTGTVVGTVNDTGGTVFAGPGIGTPGTLTVSGTYNQSGTGDLEANIGSGGTSSGVVADTGGYVNLSGGTLSVSSTPAIGSLLTVMTFGAGHLVGQFAHVQDGTSTGDGGSVNLGDGTTLEVFYNNDSGDIQIERVNNTSLAANYNWTDATGNWSTAADWSGGVVPNPTANVVIGNTATGNVTLNNSSGDTTVNSLSILAANALTISGVTLTSATGGAGISVAATASLSLVNGEINGSVLSGAGLLQTSAGTGALAADTISANTSFIGQDNTTTELLGAIDNAGTLEQLGGNGQNGVLDVITPVTLSGGGTVTLSTNPTNGGNAYIEGNGETLTTNNTIQGTGIIGNGSLALINSGVIDATPEGGTSTLSLNGSGGFTNTGTLEATGGATLVINYPVVDNANGNITAVGTSTVEVFNATIQGGTLNNASGGTLETVSSAELDGSTQGALTISTGSTYTASDNATTYLLGSIVNKGLIQQNGGNGQNGILDIFTPVTLSGGGTVTLNTVTTNGGNAYIQGNGNTLTNTNNTIQGTGFIGNGSLVLINQHVVDATPEGGTSTLTLNGSGGITNTDLLEATAGGVLVINTTVNNFNGNITVSGSTSAVQLFNATVQGGTLNNASGGTLDTVSTAELDGSTQGALTISSGSTYTASDNTTTYLLGSIVNKGLILLNGGNGQNGFLDIFTSVTLSGGGTLTLDTAANNGGSAYILGNGNTLTNTNNTIQGTGVIGNGSLALINNSVIDAMVVGGTLGTTSLTLNGSGVTNTDLLEASAGATLLIQTNVTNTAANITASGSLAAVTVSNGATITGGTLNTVNGGIIESTGAATLQGVTISAHSTYTASDNLSTTLLGTIDNVGAIELIGGNSQNGFLFIGNAVTLTGGGTVTLDTIATNNGAAFLLGNGETLTNANNTIQGTGIIGNGSLVLINQGLIDATPEGGTNSLTLNGNGVTNTSTMEASGGGVLVINTTVDNAGGTITTADAASTVEIDSGTVQGGTLNNTAGGTFETVSGSVLDGSTQGTLTISKGSVVTATDNTTTYLKGTIDNAGLIEQVGGNAQAGYLYIDSSAVTLTGGGTVTLDTIATSNGDAFLMGNGNTLTNTNNTIQGTGIIGNGSLALINEGVIDATPEGGTSTLTLNGSGGITNTSTMETSAGGVLLIETTVDNAGGNITTADAASTVEIDGGTVQGGTLSNTAGGTFETAASAVLDGSTQGTLTISAGSVVTTTDNTTTYLKGSIDNAGTIEQIGGNGQAGNLYIDSAVTLTGGGTVTLDTIATNNGDAYLTGNSETLTNTNNTIQGTGIIGNGSLALINEGVIDATPEGGTSTLTVNTSGAFTSTGTLEATGGATLALNIGAVSVSGLVAVAASSVLSLFGELTVTGTLSNFGAVIGGGATEVAFGSGTDRLILGPGATFGGTVVGGGVNSTIELAAGTGAGTLNALGTTFTNFGTVIVDAGATWTVDTATSLLPSTTFIGNGALSTLALSSAGTFSLATVSNFGTIDLASGNNVVTVTDKTLSGGAVTIVAGASGNNVISAAGDTAASKGKSLTYVTGTGTDSFTGGFENDTVAVSAAAVGGDTLTGGSGTNTLVMTSAGTLSLGGVSKFPTIDLAAGNSTVTVTDALLSGSPVTINDGASGNNTISATTDTAASKGKTLTYNAGSGTDSFTGGFENDKVNVSAAAVGGDTLTGGSGTNTLALTSAGSANLGGVSKFPTIDLASGNNVVTVTDTTLSGGSVTIIDGASGNNSVSAAGDTSASKGKTLTYNAGTGTDSFTGGFENDTVSVSAAAAGGDTLTGGSGSNTLLLTSAGTVNLGGVSKFATIDLAAGNSTVTVTDTTLSGGSVTLHDGASGNDTVSAATDTAASKGKTLSYHTGTGTDHFTGGFENDSVDVSAAAVGGDVLTGGSGSNTLVLTSAGTVSLGTVSRFATIDLATGNSTVTITDTTLNGSPAVGVHDAASGNNSVSAAGDTAASKGKTLTYYTGTGTDSFTGGFENDTVNVSAAAVGGDTLTGGSGSNLLVLTSAGTYSLGGASKFATIDLGAGNNTVTLTDAVFSIGAVGLHDPASGNQTVSAATDTAASKGKNLTYYVGAGTDNFTGGFENDTIRITAAAISGDVLTGGSGTNTVVLTSAGTVNLGGISKFGATDLASGNNTVTLTDTTFSGGGMTLKEGATGNDTVSAATDTTASKGKTLNYLAGPGTDSFTGGFENDTVSVLAAAVGGDTLTGGSGTNTLVLTSGGSANLGGVSKFAAIDLAAASSTVTVTDTTLSGGTVSLHDGAAGNDTVSAATDTAASKGKSFSYFAGTGKDSFTGGFENDTVNVSAAAVGGDVLTGGSGTNTLVLAGAGTVNLGGVSKFATIDLAAGNSTVTLTDTTLNIGAVALHDASGNETVSAAGDTAASTGKSLTYYVGSGTDSFTGGFENDTIRAAAAAAGGDVLTGGSGTNALVLTSAGAVNLGGVSRFPTVFLAAGNNAVTVTDTTLSGGTLTIKPGSSGNETISAAGDTAASSGKSLIYMAGAGADNFTGGFENDTIYAGTGLGTYTAGSGTDSFVFIADNLASQTLGNFQVASDNVLVYGIHASNGFDLGSTDNALNPTTPTAITASIFIASTSGEFTSSSQRFAYDTTNGALHYSATGSNGSESLVATLTGAPAFTAGDLVFEH